MELYFQHLDESKKLIEEKAKRILLNKNDLETDEPIFAPLKQKAENIIIFDHLKDLANDRLEHFNALCNNEALNIKYREELIIHLGEMGKKYI